MPRSRNVKYNVKKKKKDNLNEFIKYILQNFTIILKYIKYQ